MLQHSVITHLTDRAGNNYVDACLMLDGDAYLLAWTTTPWTLPSNTALSINKKITYVVIKTFNQYTHKSIQIIFEKKLIDKILDGKYYRV